MRVWRKRRIFANPGMLFQTDESYSSRLVIFARSRGVQADPQADLEWNLSYGQVVSSERDDQILAST